MSRAPRPRPPFTRGAETASRWHRADLELLADLVAERLAERLDAPRAGRMLTASEAAVLLGVSRSWLYDHADELGAVRLGSGPRGRLRFDAAALTAREESRRSDPALGPMATGNRGRRRATSGQASAHTAPNLLPIRGRGG